MPVLNFWAFYRIKKLRRYVGYLTLPTLAAYYIFGILPGIILFIGLSIYLVIKWSRKHNRQFDQPATQTQSSA
jgi:hypothetical protein